MKNHYKFHSNTINIRRGGYISQAMAIPESSRREHGWIEPTTRDAPGGLVFGDPKRKLVIGKLSWKSVWLIKAGVLSHIFNIFFLKSVCFCMFFVYSSSLLDKFARKNVCSSCPFLCIHVFFLTLEPAVFGRVGSDTHFLWVLSHEFSRGATKVEQQLDADRIRKIEPFSRPNPCSLFACGETSIFNAWEFSQNRSLDKKYHVVCRVVSPLYVRKTHI